MTINLFLKQQLLALAIHESYPSSLKEIPVSKFLPRVSRLVGLGHATEERTLLEKEPFMFIHVLPEQQISQQKLLMMHIFIYIRDTTNLIAILKRGYPPDTVLW